jgi:FlaA1/EpsC-like NDP-sugar epimerase
MLKKIIEAKRSTKRAASLIYDALAISASLYLAYALRLGDFSYEFGESTIPLLGITITASLACFIRLGLYRAILRYMPYQALVTVLAGLCISSIALTLTGFYLEAFVPRSVPIIYILLGMFFIGLPRLMVRAIIGLLYPIQECKKVIIYGAGLHGTQLATALFQHGEYKTIAFIDDNKQLQGSTIRGIRVHKPRAITSILSKHKVEKILLAITAVDKRNKAIRAIEEFKIPVETIPPVGDIVSGKAKIEELRHVGIEDLLGRDPITPIKELISANITDKTVMITGAGGSIGSELCRQIASNSPRHIILFELNEFNLYQIEQELELKFHNLKITSLLGSVQHENRLKTIFQEHQVDTLYHAAAYKHVPLIEKNIIEGVRNNLFGTWKCAEAAGAAGIKNFVLISTDKAVRPTNIMGATKRLAELSVQALVEKHSNTTYSMVRFGNVLGSSGSVVPKFRQQIQQGGPITVTHPEVTRYFMTIPEAAQLVIQASAMAQGGDVFVLEMGKPVKIVDLAHEMIHLSGRAVKDDSNSDGIAVEFTGLRPGEKLYEELLVGNNVSGTAHPRIMRAAEESISENKLNEMIKTLDYFCHQSAPDKIKEIIKNGPACYNTECKGNIVNIR